ncbi:hypothetical protein KBK24_0115785 [Burkholderia sp. K24]|nr:hypothetical protein KBK24_0115785 [Burkholderia sp. K24]
MAIELVPVAFVQKAEFVPSIAILVSIVLVVQPPMAVPVAAKASAAPPVASIAKTSAILLELFFPRLLAPSGAAT